MAFSCVCVLNKYEQKLLRLHAKRTTNILLSCVVVAVVLLVVVVF